MPANRRRTEITAPPDRWQRLGKLLEDRRKELGYTYRVPAFERDSGVNRRMAADIEKAAKDRINRFMPGTLHIIARGYRVTEESVRAVLRGEADALVPAGAAVRSLPAPDITPADPPGWPPERTAADRPFFDPVNKQLLNLARKGIRDPSGTPPDSESWNPSGAQMFGEATLAATVWDIEGRDLPLWDRVWLVADVQRLAAERSGNSGTGTSGALIAQ